MYYVFGFIAFVFFLFFALIIGGELAKWFERWSDRRFEKEMEREHKKFAERLIRHMRMGKCKDTNWPNDPFDLTDSLAKLKEENNGRQKR